MRPARGPPRLAKSPGAGCRTARPNENAAPKAYSAHLNRTFMAFKRAEASSADWPPDKNAIAWNSSGDGSQEDNSPWRRPPRPLLLARQVNPGSTMLGFRIMPSSITR